MNRKEIDTVTVGEGLPARLDRTNGNCELLR